MNPVALKAPLQRAAKRFKTRPQEEQMLLLAGLSYTPAAVLIPIITHHQLKRNENVSRQDRKLLTNMAITRQGVSAALHYLSYYGSILATNRLLNRSAGEKPASLKAEVNKAFESRLTRSGRWITRNKALFQFGVAAAMSAAVDGVLKPLISNWVLMEWMFQPKDIAHAKALKQQLNVNPENRLTKSRSVSSISPHFGQPFFQPVANTESNPFVTHGYVQSPWQISQDMAR